MKKVLILGSAFNPPHLGHADTVLQFIDKYDEILLVPSYAHGFGKDMKPFEHRMALTESFAEQFQVNHEAFSYNKVKVSDVEKDIYNAMEEKGPVYTYPLLWWLQNKYGTGVEISFLIGPDNQANFEKFYKHEEIKERWNVVVADERINVRSSKVRPLITEDMIHRKEIECMTGKAVSDVIFNNIDLWVS